MVGGMIVGKSWVALHSHTNSRDFQPFHNITSTGFTYLTQMRTKEVVTAENIFQAFASVSPTLREGIKHFNDKVTIGFVKCKVYDRYHVKRCYNCQVFGHYAKDCPTPNEHVCGKCNGGHLTNDCDVTQPECANCVREKVKDNKHAFDPKCPTLIKNQVIEKKKLVTNFHRLTLFRGGCKFTHPSADLA